MNTTQKYIRREPADVKPWTETCGLIRPLIAEEDGAAAEVHHLEITDAKFHYHERTDEIYYIIGGHGRMALDDAEVELREGVVLYVPRGGQAPGVGRPESSGRVYSTRCLKRCSRGVAVCIRTM